MRLLPLIIAAFALVAPPPVRAELIRFELGSESRVGVPQTHEALLARCQDAGLAIIWQEQPYYDRHYSVNSGAWVASLAVQTPLEAVTVSWSAFDDEHAAEQHAVELATMYGGAGYLMFRVDERWLLTVYAQSGNSPASEALLDVLTGLR